MDVSRLPVENLRVNSYRIYFDYDNNNNIIILAASSDNDHYMQLTVAKGTHAHHHHHHTPTTVAVNGVQPLITGRYIKCVTPNFVVITMRHSIRI